MNFSKMLTFITMQTYSLSGQPVLCSVLVTFTMFIVNGISRSISENVGTVQILWITYYPHCRQQSCEIQAYLWALFYLYDTTPVGHRLWMSILFIFSHGCRKRGGLTSRKHWRTSQWTQQDSECSSTWCNQTASFAWGWRSDRRLLENWDVKVWRTRLSSSGRRV